MGILLATQYFLIVMHHIISIVPTQLCMDAAVAVVINVLFVLDAPSNPDEAG